MEKVGFLIIYLTLISVLLILACVTQKTQKAIPMFGTIFVVIVLIGAAFYLFQFGSLSSFTIKAMSAEASFVKGKVKEVKEDAETINALRQAIESQAKGLTKVVDSVKKSESDISRVRNRVVGIESDLVKLERGLVEIQYLTYAGRNVFPNPYHERIMRRLNDLLIIAIPDPQQRGIFVKDLEGYTSKQGPK
jgi:hypothetical protein